MKNSLYSITQKITAFVFAVALVLAPLPYGNARAAELVCTPNDAQVIYSDATTQVLPESGNATVIEAHPAWASIASSSWIWNAPLGEAEGYADSHPQGSVTFSKTFDIATGTPTASIIEIAADNTYSISVNGNLALDTGTSVSDGHFAETKTWAIPADQLVSGPNQIVIVSSNGPRPEGYTGANPAGLIFKATINSETCVVPPPDVTVTIVKYIDGVQATALNASSTSFSMTANWSATNIGSGTGNYELDADGFNGNPTPYQAITSPMTSGANYSTNENGVPSVCTTETPYALQGYKVGNSIEDAMATATTSDAVLTNITSNKYIIVLNQNCDLLAPTAPEHVSPANGSSQTTAELEKIDWTDSTGIHAPITYTYKVSYDSSVNPDGSLVNAFITTPNIADSEIASPGAPEAVYYWQVRATDANGNNSAWTTPWKLIVDNTAPSLPTHLSKPDGAYVTTAGGDMLDWTDSTDVGPVQYHYESSLASTTNEDGSFTNPIYGPATTTDSFIATAGTPDGVYYWHVRAVDAGGRTSAWTTPWKITVDNVAPLTPTHVSPEDGITLTTATWLSADWTDSTDNSSSSVTYVYESSNASSTTGAGLFTHPVWTSGTLTESMTPTTGTPEGTYYWHVQATDAAGNKSPWTAAWKVIVSNSTSTSTTTPPTEPATTTTATSTIIVRPSDNQGWSTSATTPGGNVTFVADATAPAGTAALKLTTNASTTAKAQYMHAASSTLASTTVLSYYTKQNSASFAQGLPSYQLVMFLTGTSTGFTTLVYEPYQGQTSTAVATGTWQQWDVAAGKFWSSRTVVCEEGTVTAGAGGPAIYTLDQIRSMCPNATVGGFGVNIGTYNTDYDVQTDLFHFNGTTYDFELDETTTNTETPNGGGSPSGDPQLNPNAPTGGGSGGGAFFAPNGGSGQTGGSTSTSTNPFFGGTGGDNSSFLVAANTGGNNPAGTQGNGGNNIPEITSTGTSTDADTLANGTTTATSTGDLENDNSNQLAAVGSLFDGNSWWMWLLGIILLIILGWFGYRYGKNNTPTN